MIHAYRKKQPTIMIDTRSALITTLHKITNKISVNVCDSKKWVLLLFLKVH